MYSQKLGHTFSSNLTKPSQPCSVHFQPPRPNRGLAQAKQAFPCLRASSTSLRCRNLGVCRAETIDAEASNVEPSRAEAEARDGEVIDDEVEDGEEAGDEDVEDIPLTEDEFTFLMDQPNPSNLQQTLYKSFVLEAICQHGGHMSCIRVNPAYANEGRYFVVVPHGSIPAPEEYPPEAEAKLKEIEEAHELEKQGKQMPGGKSVRDLEEELQVDIEPDELKARGDDEKIIMPSLDTAAILPEDAMFLTFEDGEERIINAETLLAALEAAGVENARIEIEAKEDASGPLEVPCPDGSSAVYSDFIKFAGVRYSPSQDGTEHVPKKRIIPQKVISVRDGESFIQCIPSKFRRVTVGLDLTEEAPIIGSSFCTWSPEDVLTDHWRWTVAPARPFIVSPEVGQAMQAEGYYKGAGDESVAVANFTSWADDEAMRYEDEPARRRLLEFVADLALVNQNGRGGVPEGHIVAFNASRELQLKFLQALLRNSEIVDDSSEVPEIPEEMLEDEENTET